MSCAQATLLPENDRAPPAEEAHHKRRWIMDQREFLPEEDLVPFILAGYDYLEHCHSEAVADRGLGLGWPGVLLPHLGEYGPERIACLPVASDSRVGWWTARLESGHLHPPRQRKVPHRRRDQGVPTQNATACDMVWAVQLRCRPDRIAICWVKVWRTQRGSPANRQEGKWLHHFTHSLGSSSCRQPRRQAAAADPAGDPSPVLASGSAPPVQLLVLQTTLIASRSLALALPSKVFIEFDHFLRGAVDSVEARLRSLLLIPDSQFDWLPFYDWEAYH